MLSVLQNRWAAACRDRRFGWRAGTLLVALLFVGVALWASPAQAQHEVQGEVTDAEEGTTLPGVNVVVKGTNIGTSTDAQGGYTLSAPSPQDTLVFSFVGYQTREVPIRGRMQIDVQLAADVASLDELVVVGYGTVKKSDLTGAVSSVKAEKLEQTANSSIGQMLQGQAPGLTITRNSAQPGGGVDFLIRGAASTGAGNDPLIVVDGYPITSDPIEPGTGNRYEAGSHSPLNTLNPSDIESIEVLKGVSATAIYGARAANGVILVTTKQGQSGQPRVNYSMSLSHERVADHMDVLNAREHMIETNRQLKERYLTENNLPPYGNADPSSVGPFEPRYSEQEIAAAGTGTNWFEEVMRQGTVQQHDLSVSGGNEWTKYFVSFNYFDENGIIEDHNFERYSGRVNLDQKINDRFQLSLNLTRSKVLNDNVPLGNGLNENSSIVTSALRFNPKIPVKNEEGQYALSPGEPFIPNPVSLLEITDQSATTRTLANASLTADLTSDLGAGVKIGFEERDGMHRSYMPRTTLYGDRVNGRGSINQSSAFNYLLESTLNYESTIFGSHNVKGLLGTSFQEFRWDGFSAQNQNFLTDRFRYNNLEAGSAERPEVDSHKRRNRLISFFGRLKYNIDSKYLLTFTLRSDGSTKFGEGNRFGYFPSAAAAWRVSEEPFMEEVDFLSSLKLRASYGQTGNSNIGANALAFYSTGRNYVFGDKNHVGVNKSQLANPNLKWETTTEMNLGVDFGFFDERVSGTVEVFNKEVSDLLDSRQLKSFLEVTSVADNLGKTSSKGVEVALTTQNLVGDFNWTTDVNFSTYRDRWEERNPDAILSVFESENDYIRSWFGYKADGIIQPGEEVPHMPNATPGMLKFKDINGLDENGDLTGEPDGKLNEADVTFLGTPDPGYTIGMRNTFEWNGFDLSVFLHAMGDRQRYNSARASYTTELNFLAVGRNFSEEIKDRWTSDNQDGTLPVGFTNPYQNQSNSFYIEDASFIRLQNLTFGYSLPLQSLDFIQNARVYLNAQNLFVLTEYSGVDPETGGENGSYPNQRTYSLGVNLTF